MASALNNSGLDLSNSIKFIEHTSDGDNWSNSVEDSNETVSNDGGQTNGNKNAVSDTNMNENDFKVNCIVHKLHMRVS